MDETAIIGVEGAFNPGFPPRFLDRHKFKQDTQLLACIIEVIAGIMPPVIYNQCFWKSVDWPGMFCSVEFLAIRFGEDAMVQACLNSKVAWWFKSHVEPIGHTTVGIYFFGDCWSSNGQAVHKVDDNKVKFRVVYLYSFINSCWFRASKH